MIMKDTILHLILENLILSSSKNVHLKKKQALTQMWKLCWPLFVLLILCDSISTEIIKSDTWTRKSCQEKRSLTGLGKTSEEIIELRAKDIEDTCKQLGIEERTCEELLKRLIQISNSSKQIKENAKEMQRQMPIECERESKHENEDRNEIMAHQNNEKIWDENKATVHITNIVGSLEGNNNGQWSVMAQWELDLIKQVERNNESIESANSEQLTWVINHVNGDKNATMSFQIRMRLCFDQTLVCTLYSNEFVLHFSLFDFSSLILSSMQKHTLLHFLPAEFRTSSFQMALLYRGSRDGFTSQRFHQLCDGKGPTVTVILSDVFLQVFGGFTLSLWEQPWNFLHSFANDSSAFLFSLTHSPQKWVVRPNYVHEAVFHHPYFGPCFG
ncbi:hypothetical protein RFI_00860 [Reticulomyxa filosa]|uniref:TLDc domain-containing protein n=1 Tax=Reticulomyxa filosa TaxID=46433 RepID=X6PEU3_RETFI|nr:hypothetical protein RFI_00860 [Reticulomyxa filosa]|eukprot:ETO36202.1 hypothetical protein RFI_00860 [Reticulomyxa filosa]